MSLVDTDGCQEARELESAMELARMLRMAMADELAAATLYSKIKEVIEKSFNADVEIPFVKKAKDELQEIYNDEANHAGKLLGILAALDEQYVNHFMDGIRGKDANS